MMISLVYLGIVFFTALMWYITYAALSPSEPPEEPPR